LSKKLKEVGKEVAGNVDLMTPTFARYNLLDSWQSFITAGILESELGVGR
jgi:hypothetical protein